MTANVTLYSSWENPACPFCACLFQPCHEKIIISLLQHETSIVWLETFLLLFLTWCQQHESTARTCSLCLCVHMHPWIYRVCECSVLAFNLGNLWLSVVLFHSIYPFPSGTFESNPTHRPAVSWRAAIDTVHVCMCVRLHTSSVLSTIFQPIWWTACEGIHWAGDIECSRQKITIKSAFQHCLELLILCIFRY